MDGSTPILRTEGLVKAFGGLLAVNRVNLSIQRGEIRALIGPNGAGKTTFFNLLTGHLKPEQGRILFKGSSIAGLPPYRIWRKGISRTFQVPAVFSTKTVFENVQIAVLSDERRTFNLLSSSREMGRDKVEGLLDTVRLLDQAGKISGFLSYGDLKKLELAIAIANDPKVLLLDEPTAGMAPSERGVLMELIREIALKRGLTVLFTEHDMDVVFTIAQRITVLHQGQVISEGTPEKVKEDPKVQEIYLGEGG